MFVMTCMAGMVAMTTLNNHPEVIKIPISTATTTINSTAKVSTSATTMTSMTTPTNSPTSAMLFLQKEFYQNQPTNHLIDTENELSTYFDMNGQEVYGSCGVTFKNNYYIFGGQYTSMRILQVSACYLINIGSLGFYSSLGASGSNEDVMVLCFGSGDMKSCRKASSPNGTWTEMALSTYEHRFTAIAASPGN